MAEALLMTVVVRSLGSGSSGNALLIETERSCLLVDCGTSARSIAAALQRTAAGAGGLTTLLLTHEHTDHVRSLPRLSLRGVRVVATPGTARALGLPNDLVTPIELGGQLALADATVTALGVSHDAAEPCGYSIVAGDTPITVITDLGEPDARLCKPVAASDLIVIEANHDAEMLRRGPYPAPLKRRVGAPTGHLSNADCGILLREALARSNRSRTIWLAHLSAVNNRPEIAVSTVTDAIGEQAAFHSIVPLPRTGRPISWRSNGATPVTQSQQLTLL